MLGKHVRVRGRCGVVAWVTELPTVNGTETYYHINLWGAGTTVATIDEIEVIQ